MSLPVAPDEGNAPVAERLGPYLIRSRLGAGGMGEVYLAWHELLDRLVALKRIRSDRAGDPLYRERLMNEARAVAKLSHPSIVGIHDVFESDGGPCVVMEFVPGRTLAQVIAERGRLGPAEALAFGRDVAEGLAAAHARGLVHRDLKSDNVMITPGGRAVILDFGLARLEHGGPPEAAGMLAGTPHTLAPEQIEGKADARSDLFALGVLLYEMLSGISPFRGETWSESLRRVASHQPAPLGELRRDLPAGLSELAGRLLAKDPGARPASAAAVAKALAAFGDTPDDGDAPTASFIRPLPEPASSGVPASAHPAAAVPRQRSSATLSRAPAIAAAAILALALLAAGFWLLRPAPEVRRVLLLPPRVDAELPDGRLLASALLSAGLAEVSAFGGLAAIDPSVVADAGASPLAALRAAAADEALVTEIAAGPTGNLQVSLRRIDRSGQALYSASLEVPPRPVDLRWAAEAFSVALQSAFRDVEERGEAPRLDIESADYADFVRILDATLGDGFATSDRLAELDRLARRAPAFLPLQLTLGQMALRRYGDSRDSQDLEKGLVTARRCLELAPEHPQALKLAFEAELAAGRLEESALLLGRLEQLGGRGAMALHGRARLADRQGRPEEALELSARLAELEPSWQNLYQLADREIRLGRIGDARRHLGEVLEVVPGNARAKTKLAELELLYGEVAAAERLFAELIAEKPRRSLLTNRGLSLFLLGRLDEARRSFEEALALAPGHPAATLNLADLLAARGEAAEAARLYQEVRQRFEEQRRKAPLSPADTMILAQCLAHLGEVREAVALTQSIQLDGQGGELAFQAAIVYGAAGDRTSALVAAEKALAGGVQPRWFALPALGALREEPELRRLLAR